MVSYYQKFLERYYIRTWFVVIGNSEPVTSDFLVFQNVNAIEVSVPVGNTDHTTLVVGLTTFIVSGGTVYLMVTLFRTIDKQKTS